MAIGLGQVGSGENPLTRRPRREESCVAMKHQARGRGFAADRATLVVAMASDELFQVVVRARQIGNVEARKQAWSVTPGHLQKMRDSRSQFPGHIAITRHRAHQSA